MRAATGCRVYGPVAIKTMGSAFEEAYSGLSAQSRQQRNMRRDLALCIFRLFDEGERTSSRLAMLALANVIHPRHAKVRTTYFNQIGVLMPLRH